MRRKAGRRRRAACRRRSFFCALFLSSFCDLGEKRGGRRARYICWGHWSRFVPQTGTNDPFSIF
jgi:hypothetical protein